MVREEPEGNSSREIARYDVVEAHIPEEFTKSSSYGDISDYDYALIYVEEKEDEKISDYGIFNMSISSDEFMGSNANITVSGFPGGTLTNPSALNTALYNSEGNILDIRTFSMSNLQYSIAYNAYISGGNSGGPVYMTTEFNGVTYRNVVGIVSGIAKIVSGSETFRYNFAKRITPDLMRFYFNNEYIATTITQ